MTLHVLLKRENRKLSQVKDTSGLMALVVLPILSKSKMMSFMAKSSFSWIIKKHQVKYIHQLIQFSNYEKYFYINMNSL